MKKLVLVAMAAVVLGLQAAPASAATGFARDGAFAVQGTDGGAVHQRRIAVNHTTGDVYVADQQNDRVSVYRPSSNGDADLLTSFGSGDLTDPYGIAIDQGSGAVYVSDVDGVTKYDGDGAATPAFTLDATFGPIVASGPLSFDQVADQLLLADTGANVVRRYSAAGAPLAVFDGSAGLGSPGVFTGLQDLAVDSTGDIVVIDAQGDPGTGAVSRVERFAGSGAWEATIGPVDQAATVGIVLVSDEVIVSGNQDSVNDDSLPTLQRFAADGTDLGSITIDDSLRYSTISGIAADDGVGGSLFVASDVSAGGYVGAFGTVSVQVYAAATVPTAAIASVTGVGQTVATLHGSVNPQGEAATYRFELSSDAGVTWTAAAGPDGDAAVDDSAGNATSDTPVQTTATGLEPNTAYEVRLVVTSRAGSATTGPETFTTDLAPPVATTTAANGITKSSAKLNGRVDPQGSPTTYWFEYGTTTAYGASTPVAQNGDAGSGNAPVDVTHTITGLQPATAYHYRLVAQNAQGTTHGDDHSLQSRAGATPAAADACPNAEVRAQQGASYLPDCRAYELVTPDDNNGLYPAQGQGAAVNPDGDAASFNAQGSLPGTDSRTGVANSYYSRRGTGGWSTVSITPGLDPDLPFDLTATTLAHAWSADLSHFVLSQGTQPVLPGQAPTGSARALFLTNGQGDPLTWITRPTVPSPEGDAEFSTIPIMSANNAFFDAVPTNGDPVKLVAEDAGRVSGPGAYEYAGGRLRAVGVLPDGTIPAGGARFPQNLNDSYPALPYEHEISDDGRRAVFIATPPGASGNNVYQRIDGEATILVSKSMLTGQAAPSGASFATASPDGSRVWFTSEDQLTSDAPPTGSGDGIYRFDAASGAVTYLSDQRKPYASSVDGMRYTYIKPGTQQLWLDDHGRQSLIATVDAFLAGVPDARQVGGAADGSRFLFTTTEPLGAGEFNNGGGFAQAYLYDIGEHRLSCLSCPPEGTPPTGDARISGLGYPQRAVERAMSVDGRRVAFSTPSRLVAQDTNKRRDVYEWTSDGVGLISDGTSAKDANFVNMSQDGNSIFLFTENALSPTDHDSERDLYSVRVDGGFLVAKSQTKCDLDCQSPLAANAPAVEPGSSEPGAGNPSPVLRGVVRLQPLSAAARAALSRTGHTNLKVTVNQAGRVSVSGSAKIGKHTRRVVSVTRQATKAGTVTVSIGLSKAARTQLRRQGQLKLALSVAFSKARDKSTSAVTLKRTAAKKSTATRKGA